MYNYFVLVGTLEEVFKDRYIRIRLSDNQKFIIKIEEDLEMVSEELIGKTISVSGEMIMTNLIELVCKRYLFA